MTRTLADLHPDEEALIARIEGDDPLSHRLAELGFTRGTAVRFVRTAPLGDPIQVRIRGFEVAVRSREARRVLVD